MKKERKKKSSDAPKNKHRFPDALLSKLEEAGLDTKNLIFCCSGDMDNDACYRNAWLCFDEKGFYIAFGTEELVRIKHKKHVETKYTVEEIISFPIDDFDSLETERYVSTGRLIAVKTANRQALCVSQSAESVSLTTSQKHSTPSEKTEKLKFRPPQSPKEKNAKNAASPALTERTSAKNAERIPPLPFVFSNSSADIFRRLLPSSQLCCSALRFPFLFRR